MTQLTYTLDNVASGPQNSELAGVLGYQLYICNTEGCLYRGLGHYGTNGFDVGHRHSRIFGMKWTVDIEKWNDDDWAVFLVFQNDAPLTPTDVSLYSLALAEAANTCLDLNNKANGLTRRLNAKDFPA